MPPMSSSEDETGVKLIIIIIIIISTKKSPRTVDLNAERPETVELFVQEPARSVGSRPL